MGDEIRFTSCYVVAKAAERVLDVRTYHFLSHTLILISDLSKKGQKKTTFANWIEKLHGTWDILACAACTLQ